jgi:hypothetical protein
VTFNETFDVGMAMRTPVDDSNYQVPFRFTSTIAKLTYKVGPPQLTEADRKIMHTGIIKAEDQASDASHRGHRSASCRAGR